MSMDEMTGIQALERLPRHPPGPGRVKRREFEYIRHGTQCLTANLEVWCGRVIAPTLGPTRTEADFVAHMAQTVATDPVAGLGLPLGQPEHASVGDPGALGGPGLRDRGGLGEKGRAGC